jgi:hypothetical protein
MSCSHVTAGTCAQSWHSNIASKKGCVSPASEGIHRPSLENLTSLMLLIISEKKERLAGSSASWENFGTQIAQCLAPHIAEPDGASAVGPCKDRASFGVEAGAGYNFS